LREISCVAALCCSTADAIELEISLTRLAAEAERFRR
jgi:hypothetical protein